MSGVFISNSPGTQNGGNALWYFFLLHGDRIVFP